MISHDEKHFEEAELSLPINLTPMETNWPEKAVNLALEKLHTQVKCFHQYIEKRFK